MNVGLRDGRIFADSDADNTLSLSPSSWQPGEALFPRMKPITGCVRVMTTIPTFVADGGWRC